MIPTGGLIRLPGPVTVATGVAGATGVVVSPDLTGDGRGDLLVRAGRRQPRASGPGTAAGGFGARPTA